MLNNENDLPSTSRALPEPQAAKSTALMQRDPRTLEPVLPETTLAGPLELVLAPGTALSLFLPHVADVDSTVERVVLPDGVAVTLRGAHSISLRHPVDLPPLPPSYYAEAYAFAKLGSPEPGFNNAPGMLYLSEQLRTRLNRAGDTAPLDKGSKASGKGASSRKGSEKGGSNAGSAARGVMLDIVSAGSGVSLATAALTPGGVAPRLKARRMRPGVLELVLKGAGATLPATQKDLAGEDSTLAPSSTAVAPPPPAPASRAPRVPNSSHVGSSKPTWAWPLPATPLSEWVPYETLLRGILASHPFSDVDALTRRGVALRLRSSSLTGVHLLTFDMELWGQDTPRLGDVKLEGLDVRDDGHSVEVWEALVAVKRDGGGAIAYEPLSVRRKELHASTLTLSHSALLPDNRTAALPMGYDSRDLGIARNARP